MAETQSSTGSGGVLKFRLPDGSDVELAINKPEMFIGRLPENDLVLAHASVSRKHARLTLQGEQVMIEDLGSANGTFLGIERLPANTPRPLAGGASLRIGDLVGGYTQAPTALPSPAADGLPPTPMAAPAVLGELSLRLPDGRSQTFILNKPVVTIGRAADNDLIVDDRSVSRYHARLHASPDGVRIEDIGSSSGTFMETTRLTPNVPMPLLPGTALRLGQVGFSLGSGAVGGKALPAVQKPGSMKKTWMRVGLGAGIVGALLLLALLGNAVINALRQGGGNVVAVCDMPAMRVLIEGGQVYGYSRGTTPEAGAAPAVPGGPIQTLNFLDLPFPYDGGNETFGGTREQFLLAVQRKAAGGRINSFFDHMLPLYPASKDPNVPGGKEPIEQPFGDFILLFDGGLSEYDAYSGHPALDFSTYVYREPTTPVFAGADGTVHSVGTHSSGALFVKIVHTVEGVGDYMTVYWHLHPDEYFYNMLGREGQPIAAGTRVGTMGNTGFSTGHHLHFEVRFDANQDGVFAGTEAVDPFGFIPSPFYPYDPWEQAAGFPSPYLWKYAMGSVAEIPEDGGGGLPEVAATPADPAGKVEDKKANIPTICAPPKTLPPGGTVYFSQTPAPWPYGGFKAASGCALSVFDQFGTAVSVFGGPLQIVLPFSEANLDKIDPDTLQIYWRTSSEEEWEPLDTELDQEKGLAYAFTDRPGQCALMGNATEDVIPPLTTLELSGKQSPEGTYFDVVTVTLKSSDSSGIMGIEFSLDNGTTWTKYTGPFQVTPSGIPNTVAMTEEFFGGIPGVNVLLAASTDKAGNIEDPPAKFTFAIDPSENPDLKVADTTDKLPTIAPPTFGGPKVPPPTRDRLQPETLPETTEVMGPDTFPENTDPLTGMPCASPDLLKLPPAMISVTNFPVSARPQAGLSYAPFVFEMYIGEGMTRFLAMFHCNYPEVDSSDPAFEPPVLGPIRSGRLPYNSLRKLYNGFLVMASASAEVGSQLGGATTIYGSDENDVNSALIRVDQLENIAQNAALSQPPGNLTGNLFDPTPPEGGKEAPTLWVFYSFLNQVLWKFDQDVGAYLRFQDEADGSGSFVPASDRLTEQQLAFDNVVVLFGDHSVLNSEGTLIDINLLYTFNVAYLFRDGQVYEIYWTTENGDYERETGLLRPIRFVDKNFQPFPLKPGHTWVEIVDMTTTIQELDPGYWKVRFYQP